MILTYDAQPNAVVTIGNGFLNLSPECSVHPVSAAERSNDEK